MGEYTSVTNISFTGTPPYALVLKQAGGATYSWSSLDGTLLMPEGFTVESFTDKTGAPGVFIGSPMPAEPDVTPGARCGSGTVTLSASSSSAGAVIDWYGADSGDEPALSSANDTYAPFLTETTTFYAQARYPDSGLTSARVPVTATVHLYEGEITGAEN